MIVDSLPAEEAVSKAIEAFLAVFPEIQQFMQAHELCLFGGAILDIYWVYQSCQDPAERDKSMATVY